MATRTMAATDGGGNAGSMQRQQIQGMAREGSLYNLTLNEVQSQLGEPLRSMNLDELLKSIFSAEANQASGIDLEGVGHYASSSGLQRQGSIPMPRSLSKKTVDEVWRDIQQGQKKKGVGGEDRRLGHELQLNFGEMTLEDFLVKAGVVAEGSVAKHKDNLVGSSNMMGGVQGYAQGAHWFHQYHQMSAMDQQQQQAQRTSMDPYVIGRPVPHALSIGANSMLDVVYSDGQVNVSSPTLGTLSDSHTAGRKRAISSDMEDKLVERRHKRMIKNRESAARSRARKQAYTHELENKVSRLEEENKRLKKEKDLEKMLSDTPMPEVKYRLRRTSSAPF